MRTLLNGAFICCATFATAACAPVPTASIAMIPAPPITVSNPGKQAPAIAIVVPAPVPDKGEATAPAPSAPPAVVMNGPSGAGSAASANSALFGMRIVRMHNAVREAAGVDPITWDSSLAAAAKGYADRLAKTGRWEHSAMADRPGQGENLWMGTHGAFHLNEMVGAWAQEGRMFHAGAFPQVSKTGNWDDVGHYTQMIWPGSIRVGCAIRSSARYDYLVCRYSPAGNVMGSRALVATGSNPPALKIARGPVTSNSALD